jgi:hypothetical protein
MLAQISSLLCKHQNKEYYPYKRIIGNECVLTLIARLHSTVGRDSSVGTATRYGLDGPVIEFRVGAIFAAPVQTGPGAQQHSYTMGTGSFPGGKATGAWR